MADPAAKAHAVKLTLVVGLEVEIEAKERKARGLYARRLCSGNPCSEVVAPFMKQRAEDIASKNGVGHANG